jgi:hypothetical protein
MTMLFNKNEDVVQQNEDAVKQKWGCRSTKTRMQLNENKNAVKKNFICYERIRINVSKNDL